MRCSLWAKICGVQMAREDFAALRGPLPDQNLKGKHVRMVMSGCMFQRPSMRHMSYLCHTHSKHR